MLISYIELLVEDNNMCKFQMKDNSIKTHLFLRVELLIVEDVTKFPLNAIKNFYNQLLENEATGWNPT